MHIITEVFVFFFFRELQRVMFNMILFLLKYTLHITLKYMLYIDEIYKDKHLKY